MIKIENQCILEWCKTYNGPKFHSAIMDPPYELGFMGKKWDNTGIAFNPSTWKALMPHLHPGAFCMAFAGTRGYHRMACAIEDAGFLIHPAIGYLFGSGFPKGTRIDTQIQKKETMNKKKNPLSKKQTGQKNTSALSGDRNNNELLSEPTDPLAKQWQHHKYGLQALKPAFEFICVFQKPYEGKPIESITKTGAGAINIDGGRIPCKEKGQPHKLRKAGTLAGGARQGSQEIREEDKNPNSRYPSNFILSEEMAGVVDRQSGVSKSKKQEVSNKGSIWGSSDTSKHVRGHNDLGGCSRFFKQVSQQIDSADPVFYCSKAPKKQRTCDGTIECDHPTLKNIDLTTYLAKLLLPPKEYAPRKLLVPFAGVLSEALGGFFAGFEDIVAIEQDKHYCEVGQKRWNYYTRQKKLL